MKKSLFFFISLVCLIWACTNEAETLKTKPLKTNNLRVDSLDFEVLHIDVLIADSLLAYNQLDQAFSIYDSLLSVRLDDPYLEQYILGQSLRKGLRNMPDSLFQIKFKEVQEGLDKLLRPVTCLEVQKAFLEGYWQSNSQQNHSVMDNKLNFVKNLPTLNYPVQFSTLLFEIYGLLGNSFAFLAIDHYRSRDYLMTQEAMLSGNAFVSPRQIGLLYYALSSSSYFLDDFELAVEYGLKSQSYFKAIGDKRLLGFATSITLNNYPELGDSVAADKTFADLKSIIDAGDLPKPLAYLFLLNYAGVSYESDDVHRFEMALNEASKYLPENDTLNLTKFIERKAWLKEEKGRFDEAVKLQKNAIEIYSQFSEKDEFQLSTYLSNLGVLYKNYEKFDSSIFYLHKGIELELQQKISLTDSPKAEINFTAENLYINFQNIAASLQRSSFPTGDSLRNLQLANKYYDQILLDWNLLGDQTEAGMLRNLDELNDLIKETIHCKYKIGRIDKLDLNVIYKLMEKGKAILLQKSVYRRAMADQYGIPDSIFQNLLDIEEEMASIQTIGAAEENLSASLYLDLNIQKEKIQNQIEEFYPNYFNAIAAPVHTSLVELQSKLSKGEAVLEYSSSDLGTFVLGITSNNVRLKFIPTSDSLNVLISNFLKLLSKKPSGDIIKLSKEYASYAYTLDSLLIGDIFQEEHIESLNIIPDGAISRVPFEALVIDSSSNNKTFFELNYRIKSFAINYSFSSSLLIQKEKRVLKNPKIHLFAFSDQNEVRKMSVDKLKDELPASGREVDLIRKILESYSISSYKGQRCTKYNFENSLALADVLHLAVHGNADDENRYGNRLMFKNAETTSEISDSYYGFELKGINLKSRFVFLGACESGKGKAYNGEGVYSLGRNFAAAGVPSIVMGLWKLNDEVSQEMVGLFYANLSLGMVPAEALKRTKISYLENSDDRMAHPYYWAPYVSIGENSKIFN